MSAPTCIHCGLPVRIWQDTWVHDRGNRYCFSTAAEPTPDPRLIELLNLHRPVDAEDPALADDEQVCQECSTWDVHDRLVAFRVYPCPTVLIFAEGDVG